MTLGFSTAQVENATGEPSPCHRKGVVYVDFYLPAYYNNGVDQ